MKIFALKKIEMNAETNKTSLDAFLRCRLIPLDKNLGLRTIRRFTKDCKKSCDVSS